MSAPSSKSFAASWMPSLMAVRLWLTVLNDVSDSHGDDPGDHDASHRYHGG